MNNRREELILIVDDNPKNLQVIGNILRENGYKTAIAQNGLQAIDFVEKKNPILILLDIMMPEMDGFEVCGQLNKAHMTKDIPIIFITALNDSSNIIKAFETGGVDYITKPFLKEEMLARINVHVKLRNTMKRLEEISITDELTGIFNRRYAYRIIDREMSFSKREKTSFVLCFIDIDNLKILNDIYGHSAGDQLILEVVNGLKSTIRNTDYIFRMGGDEFLTLLPNTNIDDARLMIKRLNGQLNQRVVYNSPIDFSFGFSLFEPEDKKSIDELIKAADTSMYEQKIKKKNAR